MDIISMAKVINEEEHALNAELAQKAKKARKKIAMRRILSAEKEQIIYFNWEDA